MGFVFNEYSECELVTESLSRGMSVSVRGLPGSGRSFLLRRVSEALSRENYRVVTIPGVAMPELFPMSTLVSAGIVVPNSRGHVDPYSAIAELADEFAGPQRKVLVIDDADHIDPASSRAIFAAWQRTRIPVLASQDQRLGDRHSELIARIAPPVRLAPRHLRHDQIQQVICQHLALSLEPQTLAYVANLSGGLPALALSITQLLLLQGSATANDGVASLVVPDAPVDVTGACEQLLVDLPKEDVDALQALAAAEDCRVSALMGEPLWPRMAGLERAGMVQVLNIHGERELGIFPPALGKALIQQTGVLTHPQGSGGTVIAAGQIPLAAPPVDHVRDSTIRGYHLRNKWEKKGLKAHEQWVSNPCATNALAYIQALIGMQAPIESISHVLEHSDDTDTSKSGLLFQAWRSFFTAVVMQQTDVALEYLGEGERRNPQFAGAYRAVRGVISLVTGPVPDGATLEPAGIEEDPLSATFLRFLRSYVALAQGRQPAQLASPVPQKQEDFLESAGSSAEAMALFHAGRTDEALELAERSFEKSTGDMNLLWPESATYLTAILLALTGQFSRFDQHLSTIAATTTTAGIRAPELEATYGLASVLAHQRGLDDMALLYAQRSRIVTNACTVPTGIPSWFAEGLAYGRSDDTFEQGWAHVERLVELGRISSAIKMGTFILVYRPNLERSAWLVRSASGVESVLLRSLLDFSSAVCHGDATKLESLGEDFATRGFTYYAVQASVCAAVHMYRQGDFPAAVATAEKAWDIIQSTGGDLAPLLSPLVDEIGITTREIEVVSLLGTKKTNNQLAEQLYVSTRTVEQHILRAKTKLGFTGRNELIHAVSTWLSPFIPRRRHFNGGLTSESDAEDVRER